MIVKLHYLHAKAISKGHFALQGRVHNWFDNEWFAQPWTRTHPTYGGPPMTYPDGTEATGYIGDPTDPRNSRVFDAGSSKEILIVLTLTFVFVGTVSAELFNFKKQLFYKQSTLALGIDDVDIHLIQMDI